VHTKHSVRISLEENCLVVPREKLFGLNDQYAFAGFCKEWRTDVWDIIAAHGHFLPRKDMELDQHYKQIIPLGAYLFEDSLYVYQRKGGDARLVGNYDVGIGGHVHIDDFHYDSKRTLENCLKREFQEEIECTGTFTTRLLGYVNSDELMVDKVHFGLLYLLEGTSPHISSKEQDMPGELVSLDRAKNFNFKGWQSHIFNAIYDLSK
jgi:predicted NUDIX family phosphoesterase